MKVNKTLLFFCEAHFRPFPPQSDNRVFLWVDIMKPKKLVYGVGINDADYYVHKYENGKMVWRCPYYIKWSNMLMRAYSDKYKQRYPTYQSVTVCEEWHSFMRFRSWMMMQDWEGRHLDKDFLVQGNKEYSPTTCVFVDGVVNTFINEQDAGRGQWPIGCHWDKHARKFYSQCANPFTKKNENLGRFTCPKEAHNAWAKRKLELAHELAAIQTDPRVAKALINRYSKPYVDKDLK